MHHGRMLAELLLVELSCLHNRIGHLWANEK